MDEESFEMKPKKKIGFLIAIAIIAVVAIIAAVAFLFINNKPEKIFESKIKKAFSMAEKEFEDVNSERISLELTADVESNDASIIMASTMIKAAKLKSVTEVDMSKKIFNQSLSASYDGTSVLDASALIQNEQIYLYLNELFGKYIDLTEYIDDEIDLSQLFAETDVKASKQLLEDIEDTLVDTIKSKDLEQEKDEVNGKKVTKTTCTLSNKEVLQLVKEIIKDLQDNIEDKDTKDMLKDTLEEIDYELKKGYFSEKNYLEISFYTKGIKNDLVKFEMKVYTEGKETLKFEAIKDDKKTTIQITADGVLMAAVVTKDKKETNIDFYINPYGPKLSSAIKIATMNVMEENKNEGTIKLKVYAGDVMSQVDSGYKNTKLDVTLNIKYKIELNCKIEKKDVSKSIKIDDISEEDLNEILENAKKNPLLNGIINSMINSAILNDAKTAAEQYKANTTDTPEFININEIDMNGDLNSIIEDFNNRYGSDWMDETEENYLDDYIMDIRGY